MYINRYAASMRLPCRFPLPAMHPPLRFVTQLRQRPAPRFPARRSGSHFRTLQRPCYHFRLPTPLHLRLGLSYRQYKRVLQIVKGYFFRRKSREQKNFLFPACKTDWCLFTAC